MSTCFGRVKFRRAVERKRNPEKLKTGTSGSRRKSESGGEIRDEDLEMGGAGMWRKVDWKRVDRKRSCDLNRRARLVAIGDLFEG